MFYCNRESIPDCWRSYKESLFANVEFSFRKNHCLEMDVPRAIEIPEKC